MIPASLQLYHDHERISLYPARGQWRGHVIDQDDAILWVDEHAYDEPEDACHRAECALNDILNERKDTAAAERLDAEDQVEHKSETMRPVREAM